MAYKRAPLWTGQYLRPGDAGLPAYAPYGYQVAGLSAYSMRSAVAAFKRAHGLGTCTDGNPNTGIFNPFSSECWATVYSSAFGSGAPPAPTGVLSVGPTAPSNAQLTAAIGTDTSGGFTPSQAVIDPAAVAAANVAAINAAQAAGTYNPNASNVPSFSMPWWGWAGLGIGAILIVKSVRR
jgi:hypothetical protein